MDKRRMERHAERVAVGKRPVYEEDREPGIASSSYESYEYTGRSRSPPPMPMMQPSVDIDSPHPQQRVQQRRGFGSLDVSSQGIKETYARKIKQVCEQ
jgi:ribosomal protein L13E